MASNTRPERMATMAASSWAASLAQGLRLTMSSTAPIIAMITAPTRRPMTWVDMFTKSSRLITKPRKMANPPMRGMGWSWTLLPSLGTSIAPTFSANSFTGGVMR